MPRWLKFPLAALLVAIAFGVYWDSLRNPLFFDDKNLFERGHIYLLFLDGFSFTPRWLPYFMMAWTELIFDDALIVQRGISLGIHLLTAFVLYAFVKQVSNHVAPHRNNERAALAVALLFVLHPLAVYAVGYLIQRTILMATLFGLLALSTYFDGLVTRKKSYFAFSALFYLLSVFSKEHAILIPAAALALTPLATPITRQTLRLVWLPAMLYGAIAVLVVLKYQNLLGQVYEPQAASMVGSQLSAQGQATVWGLSVLTQISLFFKYLGLMLVPYPGWMSIDMRVPFATSYGEPKYVLGMLACVAYVTIAAFWLLRGGRRGMVGFALLAPLLLFAVELSAVRIQEPFVLYRAYLWMAPLFLLLPAISYRLPGKVFWPLILAIVVAFAYGTSDRLHTFSDGFLLWDDAVRKLPHEQAPGSARAHSSRGYGNVMRGELRASLDDFERAIRVDPTHQHAYQTRVWVYKKLGDFESALRDANTMVRLFPEDPKAYTLRGAVYRDMGDYDRAIADLAWACDRKWIGACLALAVTRQQQAAAQASR
ncbi:MAG: hypothetical protein AB1720_14130 [Pseudomonadota bacterium]